MTEKTCGTCANGAAWVMCKVDGEAHSPDNHCAPNLCGNYTERTDSIEQVARDMYNDYRIMVIALASFVGVSSIRERYTLPDVYMNRLHECGLEA